MSWKNLAAFPATADFLKGVLSRGRLAHGYLVVGERLETLELVARTLAATLNCTSPLEVAPSGVGLEACGQCPSCVKTNNYGHPDIRWVRAESKSRQITRDQILDLIQLVSLKPNEARHKVGVIVAADRMNERAANTFLKTLEEPPPASVLLLLTTAPGRVLETIRSRCQLVQVSGEPQLDLAGPEWDWLRQFGRTAAENPSAVLERYRLLSFLLQRLGEMKESITERLTSVSPLETTQAEDIEPDLREQWEKELEAAIEAEYRRQRTELLSALQWWLRDVWFHTLQVDPAMHRLPDQEAFTQAVARRLAPEAALKNLEEFEGTLRLLNTNVQEALALEVGLLKLKL